MNAADVFLINLGLNYLNLKKVNYTNGNYINSR